MAERLDGRQLLAHANSAHAFLDALLLAVVLLVLNTQLVTHHAGRTYIGDSATAILSTGMVYALRLRIEPGRWRRQAAFSVVILLTLNGLLFILFLLLTPTDLRNRFLFPGTEDHQTFLWAFGLSPFLSVCSYGETRALMRLWLYWDYVRHKHLRWGITHGHLLLITFTIVLINGVFWGIVSAVNEGLPVLSFISRFPTMFMCTGGCTLTALLVIFLPLAVFSFLVIRYTTQRLATLTETTMSLRAGNYHSRVEIAGEDEVARFQAHFNAMAEELDRTLHELEVERDTVAMALKSRRELFAAASHELRTPVATLRSYIESAAACAGEGGTSDLREDFAVMERQTLQIQKLIDDLFTIARTDTGNIGLVLQSIDVVGLLTQIAAGFGPMAWRRSRVKLVTDIPSDLPSIQADSMRLEQIVYNLLDNSFKHTAPGDVVIISASTTNGEVSIQVRDTGVGIPAEDLPHIWERFYRSAAAQEKQIAGTGLGLALVKELTEAMRGTVSVESEVGEGSCFTLTFPCVG